MRLARRFTGLRTECGAKPFKCLLIRPSMLFPRSRRVLFHSTSNYFNPVIAQRAPSLTVHREAHCRGDDCVGRCRHINCHWGLISMLPGLCSSGLCELRWLYCAKNKMSRDCLYSCQRFHLKGLIPLDFLVDSMKYFPGLSTQSCTLFFLQFIPKMIAEMGMAGQKNRHFLAW